MSRAVLAAALGTAALALALKLVPGPTAEGGTAAADRPVPAAEAEPLPAPQPSSPGLAAFDAGAALAAARERVGAARPADDPAGFARALRDLETALGDLRAGIAATEAEARSIARGIREEDGETKRLLASLMSASLARIEHPVPLHPAGPDAAARAAALLPAAESDLRAGAAAIGVRLQSLAAARRSGEEGRTTLAAGLAAADEARAALREAVLARASSAPDGLPDQRDPLGKLAHSSDTLTDLAGALAGPVAPEIEAAAEFAVAALAEPAVVDDVQVTRSSRNYPGLGALRLEMPVTGRVLRPFAAKDGAGVARPGLMLAAAPQALVTAPAAGEVRFVGPFLDYGRVVALAPASGTVVLLAGLAEVAVAPGDVVAAGEPIGFLGGRSLEPQDFLMLPDKGTDALGAETLYMEVWHAGEPVDPGPWLAIPPDARNG